jgi:hypothetical protein
MEIVKTLKLTQEMKCELSECMKDRDYDVWLSNCHFIKDCVVCNCILSLELRRF